MQDELPRICQRHRIIVIGGWEEATLKTEILAEVEEFETHTSSFVCNGALWETLVYTNAKYTPASFPSVAESQWSLAFALRGARELALHVGYKPEGEVLIVTGKRLTRCHTKLDSVGNFHTVAFASVTLTNGIRYVQAQKRIQEVWTTICGALARR